MKRIRQNRTVAALAAAAVLLAVASVAGCGDDTGQSSASGNPTDLAFAEAMAPHHDSAIEMADMAKERGEHPEVRALAEEIIAAQRDELRTLRQIGDQLADEGVDEGDLGLEEHTMGMDSDASALEQVRPFDRAFIDMMVPHHRGAIRMARVELDKGEDARLRRLARAIIDSQNAEVKRMLAWRKSWYGSAQGDAPSDGDMEDDHSMMDEG